MEGVAMTKPPDDFWRHRRVLVTGHTGFKGSWLTLWLARLGANVTGLAFPPATTPALFTLADIGSLCTTHSCDIRDAGVVNRVFATARPEIVFHLAAQPLVRESYREPVATFATNVLGTVHVLDAIRRSGSVRAAVIVTTDKVYRDEAPARSTPAETRGYLESDPLGGHDPYAASKAAGELVTESYRQAYLATAGSAVATARAGNVIGGGDWSADRLLPDAMRAWLTGAPLVVRRPDSVRPWQHVLDPLAGYLALAEGLWHDPTLATAYNFGPPPAAAASVRRVVDLARQTLGRGDAVFQGGDDGPHESGWLALDASRAAALLGIRPRFDLETSVSRTVGWYCRHSRGERAAALCHADIDAFEQIAS
jgi:CDP-glucose 4,6-dehydratase